MKPSKKYCRLVQCLHLSLFGLTLLISFQAKAAWYLTITEDTAVNSQSNAHAKNIGVLHAGQRVIVLGHKKKWSQIVFLRRGKKRRGYIPRSSYDPSALVYIIKNQKVNNNEALNQAYLGAAVTVAFNYRGASDTNLDGSQEVQIAEKSGSSSFPSLFYEKPYGVAASYRVFFNYRQLESEGQATLLQNGTPTLYSKVKVKQTFVSVGMTYKIFEYFKSRFLRKVWLGGGLELGRGLSGSLIYEDGINTKLGADDMPFLFIVHFAFGWQNKISENFLFLPEIRAGIATSTQPMTNIAEFIAAFAYRY